MGVWIGIVIVVAVLLVLAGATWLSMQRQRNTQLRENFGPEFERVAGETGDTRRAEAELAQRARRVERLDIRPLSPQESTQFATEWRATQARFVDEPGPAIKDADRLVADAMMARGYPVGDFEQQAEDVSVNHPRVVENYRAAHAIALRDEAGEASTEDLRQAMVHYRALFQELIETQEVAPTEVRR